MNCPKCGGKMMGPWYKDFMNKLKWICRCGYATYTEALDSK